MEVSREWKVAGKKVLNPVWVAERAREHGWPKLWYGLANSLSCPRGRRWGEAHFLVSQDTLNALDLTGPINITCEHEGGTSSFNGYYCIRTQAVSKDAGKPPHWITLADRRWLLEKSAAKIRRNLRIAPDSDGYIESTTDGGTPWTWAEIIEDLWDLLPSVAGALPSIPSRSSTPENLIFEGCSAWHAINQVLTAIGAVVCYDPLTAAITFEDVTTRSAQTYPTDRYLWRFRPESLPETNYPAKVEVTFQGIPGTGTAPFMPVPEFEEVALSGGGITGTKYPVIDTMFHWDDNSADRTARATEIADAIEGFLYPLAEPFGEVYAGIVEAKTDSDITEVIWSSDGARGMTTTVKSSFAEIDWPKLPEFVGAGGGETIEYEIISLGTGTGPFVGLVKALVLVHVGPISLVGENVDVYDHSGCIFDEDSMTGYTGWAFWGQAWSLDPEDPCETPTPFHWSAMNRCCEADTGTYAAECPPP